MSETMRIWMEVIFNSAYLVAIWVLVVLMIFRRKLASTQYRSLANSFALAFGLLALGDTGHVGFRIAGYLRGDLGATFRFAGMDVTWVGLGALSTAITVTLFYVIMLFIWKQRFDQRLGWFGGVLLLSVVARFVLMTLPGNAWDSILPPQPWSLIRNIPLMVLGLGVAYLILRDARSAGDRVFRWIGWMILVSYGFYLPVILWVQQVPLIGMLMIPKTLAYVVIAIIAYHTLIFQSQAAPTQIRTD
jgi:hypothetical protein